MNRADLKAAEATAHDVADALRRELRRLPIPGRVTVRYDKRAETWAVRLTSAGTHYDALVPAPGALWSLWRNGAWYGGMTVRAGAAPAAVAAALLRRVVFDRNR